MKNESKARNAVAAIGQTDRPAKILVVEDESMLRLMLESILQTHGYQVHAAESGEEALQLWQQHNGTFDLLLTDMMLPDGFTGRQIATELKTRQPELKVIYASGFGTEHMDDELGDELVEGVNFLQKPYTTSNLAETVRRSLTVSEASVAEAVL
jgi:CheY-like chemotaxis protein